MTIQRGAHARGDDEQPPHGHRAVGERRRLVALWGVVAVLAAGGVWVVATSHQRSAVSGAPGADKSASPAAAAGQPAQPLTESQSFLAERYFPAQRAYEYDNYRARRSAAREGAECRAVQNDKTRDVLAELGCQGWMGIALTRSDQPVVSSVTVLRFSDAAVAARALQTVREKAADFEFTYPDGLLAPAGTARPMTATKVELVGHHITLTVSRYLDQRTGEAPDELLTTSNRAAAAVAGQPFMWM